MIRTTVIALVSALLLAAAPAGGQDGSGGGDDDSAVKLLLDEIDRLTAEVASLRDELADSRQQARDALEALEELRQFVEDHHQYGDDFNEYQRVKKTTQDDARLRQQELARLEREKKKADRRARMQAARADRNRERYEQDRLQSYRDKGFNPIGLDVFIGQVAYSYSPMYGTGARRDYAWGYGSFLRFYPVGPITDFNNMTISGSVINASSRTRNIGIALTFFDEFGNQLGHETVEVKNARPNVPYPFTSSILMASNRPFASSTQYVLYADEVTP